MKTGLLIAVVGLAGGALAAQEARPIDRMAWLQGCWEMTTGARTVEEQWMAPRGGTMLGMSRTVQDGTLREFETVLLREDGAALVYEARPSGQPGASFRSRQIEPGLVVFENPQHDFPQRIGYRRDGTERVTAWIEGVMNGKERRVEFAYARVRCAAN